MTDPSPSSAAVPARPATREQLRAADFVRLTTFRRDGTPVPTPVWVVAEGSDLLVTTIDTTGKVKRVRAGSAVELTPCSRRGVVAEGAVATPATATIDPSPTTRRALDRALVAKYGWQARFFGLLQIVGRKRSHATCLRISVTSTT